MTSRKMEWAAHGVAAAVAVALVAGAFAGGGYGPERSAAAGVIVWCLAAAALVASWSSGLRLSRAGAWLAALLVALAALGVASAWWADDPGRAVASALPASLYAGVATLVLATARVGRLAWIRGVALGLAAVAAVALASRFLPGSFPDPLAGALPSARARLAYPIGYWNALGFATASALVALGWLSCRATTRAGRVAALAAVPIPALALYLTSSRGALVALAAGTALLIALERRRVALALGLALGGAAALPVIAVAAARPAFADGATGAVARTQAHTTLVALLAAVALLALARALLDGRLARSSAWRVPRPLTWALAAAATAALAALLALRLPHWVDAFRAPPAAPADGGAGLVTGHLLSAGGSGRYQFWAAAWDAFRAHPLRGLGAGGYEAWWTQHGTLAYPVRNAHSLGLETLAELGALGGLLLLAPAALLAVGAAHRRADGDGVLAAGVGLAACGLVAVAIDWTWQVPAALAPAVVGAAIALQPPARRRRPSAAWRAVGLAGVLLCVALAAVVLATEVQLDRSRAAVRAGDYDAAVRAAQAAAAVQPWAAAPRLQLALVEERRRDLPAALRAASQALARAPSDWRAWVVAARLRVKAGDLSGARAAVMRAACLQSPTGFRPVVAIGFRASIPPKRARCVERTDRRDGRARAERAGHRVAAGAG
ncbi:MAG: O-antigen ligase family protein [Actinobacteria bacterium]|nr:O-antigen ligase family protein [Actinomycetota bacterium]